MKEEIQMDLFEKLRDGIPVDMRDPEYSPAIEEMTRSGRIVFDINKDYLPLMMDRPLLHEKEKELLGHLGENASINAPFQIDMGRQVSLADNAFINHSFCASAAGGIDIGEGVMIAPQVTVLTVNHDFKDKMIIICKPVCIRKNAWIGVNVTICPGVTIGENSIIGAGSVVTKGVPDNSVAVGNPARVIRTIDMGEQEGEYEHGGMGA